MRVAPVRVPGLLWKIISRARPLTLSSRVIPQGRERASERRFTSNFL